MIESLLFSSFRLRAVNFPNRIVIAPMQMYKSAPDGLATDWHFQHLAKYAIGGAGAVMTEGLIVDPIGRNTYGDLGIWSDQHVAPLRRITDFLHQQGVVAAAQLHHAGPKSSRQRPWE
jgi:2,4-dienoyl-CoA reductase-like NADH-dependent reductase (Old Yellow Enzyme family)